MPDARAPEIQGKRSLESKRCDDGGYEQIRIDEEWQKRKSRMHCTSRTDVVVMPRSVVVMMFGWCKRTTAGRQMRTLVAALQRRSLAAVGQADGQGKEGHWLFLLPESENFF